MNEKENFNIEELCTNTVRTLSIDAIQKANSGHPGLPMGAAPMATILWLNHLQHHPKNPQWADRDRFVLSAGHGSMLLYSLLHLTGYDLSLEEIKNFRQWGSRTPGHPEFGWTPGVECTTGPLGQGAANVVGMAMAERMLAHRFNRPGFEIINHRTYCLVSDGDLMEGVSAEAASLAGHLKLGKLIYLYDDNDITLDGPTSMTFSTENVAQRYESYGWHVQKVQDGDRDYSALDQAISAAKQETEKPSIILVKTTIGFGSPNKQGQSAAHGSPLGSDEIALTKKQLNWPSTESFFIPDAAKEVFRSALTRGVTVETKWNQLFEAYTQQHPKLAEEFLQTLQGDLPENWEENLPDFQKESFLPTRKASGAVLNALAKNIPSLMGGDADLGCSTNTVLKEMGSFNGQTGSGRNIHFGVREHAMAAIANGMSYHGGVLPFVATFFCFADYMRPSIRLAALNRLNPIYVWTHDSIGLGEDGPTHQPVEHLASLRCIPNMLLLRPGDAHETREAWKIAVSNRNRPVGIVLSRQNLPVFNGDLREKTFEVSKGAYVLQEGSSAPQVTLIATGSEVSLAIQVRERLEQKNHSARVVSMPSWELFSEQSHDYQQHVLSDGFRVAIEAGSPMGWERWTGLDGEIIGLNRFGASAPGTTIFEKFGFSVDQIAENIVKRL